MPDPMTAPDPSSPLDLEAIKKLAESATPGPWRVAEEHGRDIADEGWSRVYIQSETGDLHEIAEMVWDTVEASPLCDENAEFIAAAREAVPALLAALEEAQRQNKDQREIMAQGDASRAALVQDRDEWRATVRRAMTAVKDGATTAGEIALAICSKGDGKPDIFDELAAARADAERMRQELTNVGWSSIADLHAAYVDVLERWQRSELVVAAARALAAFRKRDKNDATVPAAVYLRLIREHTAAVDTYESQESTE